MKQIVITILLGLYLLTALRLSIVDACIFNNQKTGDNGIGLCLNNSVYNAIGSLLCKINKDDAGAIPDLKIPFTKQSYVVFEL